MLSLDENPLQAAGGFILGSPKPGYSAVNLYWGYNQGHQKDFFLIDLRQLIPETTIGKDLVRHGR